MNKINKELATVYSENNMHFVMIDGGIKIPNIVKTVVIDDCSNEFAIVEITLRCNIVSNKEDALKIYNEQHNEN